MAVSDKRGWGKTVLGWFVVDGEARGEEPKGEEPRRDDQEAASPAVELQGPLPPVVEGSVDFGQIYEAAGMDSAGREQVSKAQELLRSLPTDTPATAKKQIVEAALKAFGVPTARIIEAAVAEIAALEAFIRAGQAEAQRTADAGNRRIAELEAEVARVREAMQQAVSEQETRARAANDEKLNIQPVLEFFGQEAVAKVVKESAQLSSPR